MAILWTRTKLEEFWLLWDHFSPSTLPSDNDWAILLEFWINKLEAMRDVLITNPIWLNWYLKQGLRHFRSWTSECTAVAWQLSDSVRPCPWKYLKKAQMRRSTAKTNQMTLQLAMDWQSDALSDSQLMDYQLQSVYPLPPSMATFDELELRTCLDDLPRVACFSDGSYDLEWLTMN